MDTSYLSQQVTSIIGQLHNLFDEIGVPHHERDARESELFASLSETLHNHLRTVSGEKNDMVEQARTIIKTIKQMESSLEDKASGQYYAGDNEDLKVSYPLIDCLKGLKEKHRGISKLHHERCEQVQKLVQALESYSSHLESSFVKIKLPAKASDGSFPPTFDISPSYISSVDAEFSRVYEEYTRRVAAVQQLAEEIIKLWAELGTPQAQTDSNLVQLWQNSPEQIGLHQDDLNKLKSRRDRLQEEKRARERKLKDLRSAVETLWDRLQIDNAERKEFLARSRGCGLRAINDLEDELSRLNELKRQNLHLFVEDARTQLHALWDSLYFAEEEMVEFTPMFCDVYSDALLSAHETEISRLQALKEQRAPTLALIDKHRSILKDKNDLVASSQDASRLMAKNSKGERRDPTRLLREEKMRKRIARELPKVEKDLAKMLESWEEEYGRPFLVFGERYLDALSSDAPSKAAPPRSRTPVAPPPTTRAAKTAPQPQRAGTGARDASTLRSKTPVDGATLSRGALPPSRPATAASKSPSRIPARAPLGNMQHGGNSPERRQPGAAHSTRGKENTSRSKATPTMAPPPKMRDLFSQPHDAPAARPNHQDDVFQSGGTVRARPLDDPYSDNYHTTPSAAGLSMPPPPRPREQHYQPSQCSQSDRSTVTTALGGGSSRQTSNNSSCTAPSSVSDSNWESYANSEDGEYPDDDDPRRAYAPAAPPGGAKRAYDQFDAHAAGGTLRPNGAHKKMRAGMGLAGRAPPEDAGWTDDDGY